MRPLILLTLLLSCPGIQGQEQATEILLRGRVLDVSGNPIEGVGGVYGPSESLLTVEALEKPVLRTDAEGRFELRVVVRQVVEEMDRGLLVAGDGYEAMRVMPFPSSLRYEWPPPDGVLDLGDLVLGEGFTLYGRVRDADGDPLEGVTVIASDIVAASQPFSAFLPTSTSSAALSVEDGIFSLLCVPHAGLRVEFHKPGYYSGILTPVSRSTPLQMRMEESGFVEGRVESGDEEVDPRLFAAFEANGSQLVHWEPDGTFRFGLRYPGRYRIYSDVGSPRPVSSELREGPASDLFLNLGAPDRGEGLSVRAVDGEGRAIEDFRVALRWGRTAYPLEMLDIQFEQLARLPRNGVATLPPPETEDATVGVLLVEAPGHAPKATTGLAWEGPGQNVTVTMEPEAVLQGQVVDDAGQPLPDAWVWVEKQQANASRMMFAGSGREPRPRGAVRTGKDGSFRIAGLGGDRHTVHAEVQGHSTPEPSTVSLEQGEVEDRFRIGVTRGVRLSGRITGMNQLAGSSLFVVPGTGDTVSLQQDLISTGRFVPGSRRAPVSPDGAFDLGGLAPGQSVVFLALADHARAGSRIVVKLEALDLVRDVKQELDASNVRPGLIEGRLSFSGAAVPEERLLVEVFPGEPDGSWNPGSTVRRCLVSPGQIFAIPAAPGTYHVAVREIASRLLLSRTEAPVQLRAGATVRTDMDLDVAELSVTVRPRDPDHPSVANFLQIQGESENPGQGFLPPTEGIPIQGTSRELSLYVRRGQLRLLVPDTSNRLVVDDNPSGNPAPLAGLSLTIGDEDRVEVVLELRPPQEIKRP